MNLKKISPINALNPKPKRTASPAQAEASRKNGAQSLGPISATGKQKSSKNSIRHGLTSTEHTLLADEDPIQYREVIDAFIENLRPADKAELRLVEKIGNLDWRIERLVMMETCILNMEVGINADQIAAKFRDIDAIGFIVEAWKDSLTATNCLDLLRRYLATLQHQFNTTVSNFEKFEARRLARKYDRDRDPAVEPPYHRPVFDALEADLERERELFYTDPEPESDQIPDVSELLAKLEKDANPVTPIDVWNRLMQTREHEFPNEPENPGQPLVYLQTNRPYNLEHHLRGTRFLGRLH